MGPSRKGKGRKKIRERDSGHPRVWQGRGGRVSIQTEKGQGIGVDPRTVETTEYDVKLNIVFIVYGNPRQFITLPGPSLIRLPPRPRGGRTWSVGVE